MAENRSPLEGFVSVLRDDRFREEIRSVRDDDSFVKTMAEIGTREGQELDIDWLRGALDDVRLTRPLRALADSELLGIAFMISQTDGGADSSNKLCHTDSCGGNHSGCC